jgi:serine/threonine-protein kinase
MVTGRTPFSGSTAVEVIQKHKFGLFDRPSLFAPELPQRVEETICKLLEKEPAKRFPDAFVLLRHLEQLLRIEDYVSAGVTLADSSLVERDAATVAVTTADSALPAPDRGRHGPATLMQGLMRAEIDEINRGHWLSSLFNSLIVQVAMLALVVGGGVWWFWPRTVPPEELFERGVALMKEEPSLEWLRARNEYFTPLVNADPQTWTEKAAPYLKRIELYEATRGGRGAKRGKGVSADSEPLRVLQMAQRYRESGDSGRAERTLLALRALLTSDEGEVKTYEFVGQLLEELQRERGDTSGRDRFLAESLDRADRLSAEGKQAEAREIWKGIVDLYKDDPGTDEAVTRAKAALNRDVAKP